MHVHKKKILVVDDEIRIRQLYARLLVEAGFIVRWAGDARAAINALMLEDIDLVLLDINMPIVDGKTIFDVIHEYDPSVKVVVASVYPVDRQRELIPAAQDYYDKSHGTVELLEKVADTLCEHC